MTLIPGASGPLCYQRGSRDVVLDFDMEFDGRHQPVRVWSGGDHADLTVDDFRWLCTIAGPALLNELAKGEGDGNR